MAQEYYFFDSTKDDIRRYQARHLAEILDTVLQTGLLHKDGTPTIRVVANTKDMKVRVTAGKAVIKGHLYINTDDYEITLPKTDTVKRIVLRLDTNIDNRYIKLFVTEGDTNLPKPLVRENGVYELALCQIKFDASKGYIEQTDIIDTRFNENLCGLAHSLITVPTTEYQKEWNEFVQRYEKWFQQHQNSSYATLDYVKRNDDELRRLIAEIQLGGGGGGVIEGLSFATDFDNFQNIALKTGAAKTTTIGSKYVTLEKTISGLASGDGVTLYDGTNQEQLTVSSVSGLTVNFTTTITKSFKAGANLARSMGVLESGKNQYSFGSWGDTKEFIDYNYSTTNVATKGYSDKPKIERVIIIKNFMYIHFSAYYSSTSTDTHGYVAIDLLARRITAQDNTTGKGLRAKLGFGENGTVNFLMYTNSENDLKVLTLKNGVVQNTETVSGFIKGVEPIERKEGHFNVYMGNGSMQTYKVNELGKLALLATTVDFRDKGISLSMFYLKGNYYMSSTGSIYELQGETFTKSKQGASNHDRDAPTLNLQYFKDMFDDEYLLSIVYSNYSSPNTAIIGLDEAIYTGGKVTPVSDKDFGYMSVWGLTATNLPNVPFVFYNHNTKNPRGKGLNLIGTTGNIIATYSEVIYEKAQTQELATASFVEGETVELKNDKNNKIGIPIIEITAPDRNSVKFNITMSLIIGSGKDLTSNDVRFKLPKKSNGISATVTAGSGITVKARFGNVDLVGVEKNGQTQFAGMSSAAHDELTLTMKRLSTSNTNGLKRVTGGIDA